MIATTLIQIPQWGSVTLFELLWVIIGGVTTLFCHLMLRTVTLAYFSIPKETARRIVARQYVRRELFRLSGGYSIFGSGIYLCLLDPPTPGPALTTPSGLVILAVIYYQGTLHVIQSYFDWRDRKKVVEEIEKGGIIFNE